MIEQTIRITGLQCSAIIGIHPHEETTRQPLIIDATLRIDATAVAASDSLRDTLDYAAVAQTLRDHTQRQPYRMQERLHETLLQQLIAMPGVRHATLEIYKPEALKDYGAIVSIIGERGAT